MAHSIPSSAPHPESDPSSLALFSNRPAVDLRNTTDLAAFVRFLNVVMEDWARV